MELSMDNITKQVEDAALRHYGSLFRFRPNQKEAVMDTVYKWLSGETRDVILQGPTGSGKSAIGLLAAAVLSEHYGKKGYIVISDLSLIQQYERDCEKFFNEFAVIKGQHTYTCMKNGLPFTTGVCKLKGCKQYKDIYRKFPECAGECQYLIERGKAIDSDVLVCTYSFWLIQQNLVRKVTDNPPFGMRDFVICDEAHKLTGIVQSHFSPTLADSDIGKFRNVMESGSPDDISVIDEIEDVRTKIRFTEDNKMIFDLLSEYTEKMNIVVDAADTIRRSLADKIDNDEKLSKEDKILVMNSDFVSDHYESFSEYISIIDKSGLETLVKNPSGEKIIFNCIDESYLMEKYFHNNCGYKMYMSATIGDPAAYARDTAISDYYSIDIPSTFNFEKSPIFYVADYRLSYKEKQDTLPKIVQLISATMDMYTGKRGIIQTGSYEFAKSLLEMSPAHNRKRMILYDDSKEKDEALAYFKTCNDKVIVGPSLVEGLSFDDDLCRFQIIMKVPYPSLADRFVKAKKDLKPDWYSNTTAISILQGVGRGIRSENDWCVTFIFDGCFTYLMKSSFSMFPKEFVNRIQVITPSAIGC